jgi:hypothetical protein
VMDTTLDIFIFLLKVLIFISVVFYIFLLFMQPHDKAIFGSLVLERFVVLVHNTFSSVPVD